MNRAPSKNDYWWNDHQQKCGGTFEKISEPEEYRQKKKSRKKQPQACTKQGADVKEMINVMKSRDQKDSSVKQESSISTSQETNTKEETNKLQGDGTSSKKASTTRNKKDSEPGSSRASGSQSTDIKSFFKDTTRQASTSSRDQKPAASDKESVVDLT